MPRHRDTETDTLDPGQEYDTGLPEGYDNPEQPHDGEQPDQQAQTDEATAAALAEITEFDEEIPEELKVATAPKRKRSELQEAMDAVAARAYQRWIEKDRPSAWARLPVVTYYLGPEQVPEWRKMIRLACAEVTPQGDATGVRARFSRDAFTLTEEMAQKIGKPDKAGLTVLSWAAVDKRAKNTGTPAESNGAS